MTYGVDAVSSFAQSLAKTPLIPGLVVVGVAFLAVHLAWLSDSLLGPLTIVARTLFIVGGAIALRFARVRAAVTLGLLALAFEILVVGRTMGDSHTVEAARLFVGWGLPLWLLLASVVPIRAGSPLGAILQMGLLGAVTGACFKLFGVFGAELSTWAASPLMEGAPNPVGGQLSALLFILALLGLIVRLIRFRSAMDAGLVAATTSAWLGVMSAPGSAAAGLYLAAGAAALGLAIVETGYGLAYRDALTGLPSRRALNEELAALRGKYALTMVDVDHFKSFNDKYGHDVGDQVLRLVASVLATTRGGARVFRYGGEEFTLLFPGKTPGQVRDVVDETREAVAEARLTLRSPNRPKKKSKSTKAKRTGKSSNPQVSVTASFGLAAGHSRKDTSEAVLKRADKALYKAKRAGRNRVVLG